MAYRTSPKIAAYRITVVGLSNTENKLVLYEVLTLDTTENTEQQFFTWICSSSRIQKQNTKSFDCQAVSDRLVPVTASGGCSASAKILNFGGAAPENDSLLWMWRRLGRYANSMFYVHV